MGMLHEAVIFVFYDTKTKKVLSERRLPDAKRYPNQIIFPSGTVEDKEKDDVSKALLREIREELGVTPTIYAELKETEPFFDTQTGDILLHPFVIIKWKGQLPKTVLDKGNPLIWQTLEEAAHSPIKSRSIIVERVKKYLAGK